MKILFLANRLPHRDVAGGHRLIYQRMRQLTMAGHTVGLAAFVSKENEEHIDALRQELHEVETLPMPSRVILKRMLKDYLSRSLPAIFWKNYSGPMMRLTGDMVEREKYDLVIAEFGEMGMYLYRNPYLSAVHKVVSCHRCLTTAFSKYIATAGVPWSLRIKSASQLSMLQKFEFEMYAAMDHVLTLTPEDRFTLLSEAPELPISVIPPGIDFDYLKHKTLHRQEKHPVIMMCGYFADKSNHDAALWFIEEVWPRIAPDKPDAKCLFVGEGASQRLKHAAEKKDNILVIDAVDDLRPYREQASIFINPMRLGSGLRIKVLEAMAAGLPVVTTALGAAGMPAQNGVNCFIADTPELFSDSILWLLRDRKLAGEMGIKARDMVQQQYNIRSTTAELEQVLSEVVSI